MTTLIILISLILSGLVLWQTKSNMYLTQNRFNLKWLIKPVAIVILGFITAAANPFLIERVDAGAVGLKVNLTGDERGISDYKYKTGWVPYNTWTEQFVEITTTQQHAEYSPQQIILKGGFSATVTPTFNYNVIPSAAGDMYVNLRVPLREIEQGWLQTAVLGSINNVSNRWAPDSLFNFRENYENEIISECNKHVGKWFKLTQLRTNIVPPPALQVSINNKTDAVQRAQVAEMDRLVAVAKQGEKRAIAQGDSAFDVITASGKAEAINRMQSKLSTLYIEWQKIDKWDGKNPTTVLGGNSNTMVQVK